LEGIWKHLQKFSRQRNFEKV